MKKMKLGSLFDGSGGFPLAARLCDIEPVWASEIEPYPIRVTKKNFPDMIHLGDITKINGAEIEPVDIITFGSPCQDLSVAGLRKGMKHTDNGDDETTRSGLFMEAIRIVKEMRNATQGTYPNFLIWENVFGAFSSNNGDDFWTVLKEIHGITQKEFCIPRLEDWTKSGEILGNGCSLAWRTMDAQYWGVPQMRRRIFLVADFGGHRASKILFERESLSRHHREMFKKRKETTSSSQAGTPITVQERNGKAGGGKGLLAQEDKSATLDCGNSQIVFDTKQHQHRECNKSRALDTNGNQAIQSNQGGLLVVDAHNMQTRDVQSTLCANCGSSSGRNLVFQQRTAYSSVPKNIDSNGVKVANTLDQNGGDPNCNQGGTMIVQGKLYRETMDHSYMESEKAAPLKTSSSLGPGGTSIVKDTIIVKDTTYSLNRGGHNAMAQKDKCAALKATDYKDPPIVINEQNENDVYSFNHDLRSAKFKKNMANPLTRSDYIEPPTVNKGMSVRRLTPLECARLQGFPDDWTDGVKGSDTDKYKMWGNGVALPCVLYIMEGIAEVGRE